jgi:plasmid stabilization system protein ParE
MQLSLEDITDIKAYLRGFHEGAWVKFSASLKKHISYLADMPYMYPAYDRRSPYRKMSISEYLVFYIVRETEHMVEIHRVLHSSRDISRYI